MVVPDLTRREKARVLHSIFYFCERWEAGVGHDVLRRLWARPVADGGLDIERRASRASRNLDGSSINHSLAAVVAIFVWTGDEGPLRRWLALHGAGGRLMRGELLGGYQGWMSALLRIAQQALFAGQPLSVAIDDTLRAVALLAALFTVHTGDPEQKLPMTAGGPWQCLFPGGRWKLTESMVDEIGLRTHEVAPLWDLGMPAPIWHRPRKRQQHAPARVLRRLGAPPSMATWAPSIGALIHGASEYAAAALADELNRLGVRIVGSPPTRVHFRRGSQTEGAAWCNVAEPGGWAGRVDPGPVMWVSSVGGTLAAGPKRSRVKFLAAGSPDSRPPLYAVVVGENGVEIIA